MGTKNAFRASYINKLLFVVTEIDSVVLTKYCNREGCQEL